MNKQFILKFPGQAVSLLILINLFGLGDLGRALAEDDSSIVEYQNINSDSGQVVPGRVEWVGGGDDQRLSFVPYYVLPNGTNSSPPPSTPPPPSPAEVAQPRSGENLPAQGGGFPSGYDDPSTPMVPKLSSDTSSTDIPQTPVMPTSGRKPVSSTDSNATTDQPAWPPTPAMPAPNPAPAVYIPVIQPPPENAAASVAAAYLGALANGLQASIESYFSKHRNTLVNDRAIRQRLRPQPKPSASDAGSSGDASAHQSPATVVASANSSSPSSSPIAPDTNTSPSPSAAANPSGSTALPVSLAIPTGPTSKLSPKALDALARFQAQAQAARDAGHVTQAIRLAERASALVAYRQGGDVVERYKKVQLNANASNLFGISASSDTFEGYQLVLTTNAVEAGPGIVTNPAAYFTAKSALVQAMNQINGAAGGAINLNQLFRSLDQAWAVVDFAAQMGQAAGTGITIAAVNFTTGAIQMVSHPIDSIANLANVIANINTVMEMAYTKVEAYVTTPHSAADLVQLEATIVASILPMLSGGGVAEVAADEMMLTAAAAEFANEAVPYLTDAVSGAAKLRSLAPKLLTQLTAEGVDTINVAAAAAKSSDVAATIVADAVETGAIDAVDAGQVMRVVDSAKKIGLDGAPQIKQLAATIEKSGVKAEHVNETLEAIGKSDDFARAVKATPINKPMFYVRQSGEAIPSTAYRYVGSDARYLDEFVRTGEIPGGSYYSFDKFDDMAQASSKLQIPHDARFRAEFDTLPYVDNTKIPNGDWGKADYLEPITRDFPGFGEGGATQAVIDAKVSVTKIVDLKTGRVVFER